MYCPYCKNKMEEGTIPFNTPIVLNWVSSSDKRKVRISDNVETMRLFKPLSISKVFYCEKCNVFLKVKADER